MSLGYINGNLSEVPSAFGGATVNVGGVVYAWSDALGRYVPQSRAATRRPGMCVSRVLGGSGTALTGQQSCLQQTPAQGAFSGIIPFWVNLDTAAAKAFSLSYVAASPTDANDGALLTWIAATVGGVAGGTIPQATGSGADRSGGVLFGDHIPLRSIARTDIPANPPLMLSRTLYPAGITPMAWGTGKLLAMATASGLEYKARTTTSDVVTVPTTSYPPIATAGAGSQWHMGIKFCYDGKALSVAVPGDSTRSGTGSTADYYAGIDEAARLARVDGRIIIEPAKWAIPSQTSAGMTRNVRSIIAASVRPDVILLPTWSTNDGILTGAFALGMVTALMLARECEDAGITPILLTPPCSVAVTAGAVTTLWVNHRNAVLALANDYHVCDCYGSMIDPALPGRFLSALSADGYHPNDAGYALEGAATYAFLLERF